MRRLVRVAVLAATIGTAGFAIADAMAPAPFFVIEAQAVGMDVVGLVPEGLRIDGHSRGVVTEGLLVGATMVGVDYLVFRHDGVGVIDARYFVEDEEGVTVAMTLRGFIGEPMPGLLEAMLDPEFEFADVGIPIHGAAWLQTMAPQHAYLNHTVFGFDGTINFVEGAIRMSYRPLAPLAPWNTGRGEGVLEVVGREWPLEPLRARPRSTPMSSTGLQDPCSVARQLDGHAAVVVMGTHAVAPLVKSL